MGSIILIFVLGVLGLGGLLGFLAYTSDNARKARLYRRRSVMLTEVIREVYAVAASSADVNPVAQVIVDTLTSATGTEDTLAIAWRKDRNLT